ncbi:lysylphosphatidylglycerol synthase domain-containing protein [Actinopolymorpha sp. B17G11]|uniref:lysylphosphatidylglycerol synthase transmembrane domain-containing protein n=1 Tax=Actinopolymorpha sp. B17G11 TaxID=3160861 RepID=UPI0032E38891
MAKNRTGRGSRTTAEVARRDGRGARRDRDFRLSWRGRHVLVLAAVVGLVGWLAYENRNAFDPGLWRANLHLGWALLAVAGMGLTLAGNAWNLSGASPTRLRFWPTFAAQVAGSLLRIVSPAAVGAAAVNVQYLRRAGVSGTASLGAVSVAQSVQLLLALLLLPPVAIAAGAEAELLSADGLWIALAAVAGTAVAAGAVVLVVRRSPLAEARVRMLLGELSRSLRAMAGEPRRAVVSVAGAVCVSGGLILALWSSVHAFGGSLALLTAAGVLLLGSTAGNIVPVPGGLGSVDAALVAALTATGTPLTVALPAVALFRLVTLWLLLPAGLVSLGLLRSRGQL